MAKERDRRYQSPEHLVRDLLALAGSLGLERAPSDAGTLDACTATTRGGSGTSSGWCRPLGFVVVIAGLAWWGREFSRPPAAGRDGRGGGGAPGSQTS